MGSCYTDTPHNFEEIAPYVVTDTCKIVEIIYQREKCYFYDTCSFRTHANLGQREVFYLLQYMKSQSGIIIVTRGILMELASHSGVLNAEYIRYFQWIHEFGIETLLLYEEDLFSVMDVCFTTNAKINEYLSWAVRMFKCPVSTITETLEQNTTLSSQLIKGKGLKSNHIYHIFFETVRKNKESGDNLGEELLAICLHILSHIPGEPDGKFCVITDDKGAVGKIQGLLDETAKQHQGSRIGIYSTPKLVQVLYREEILTNREHMQAILNVGTDGNLVVMGQSIFDIRNREIHLTCSKLVDLILTPNGIHIVF